MRNEDFNRHILTNAFEEVKIEKNRFVYDGYLYIASRI